MVRSTATLSPRLRISRPIASAAGTVPPGEEMKTGSFFCPSSLKTRRNWAGVSLVISPCAAIHCAQPGSQPVRLSVTMTTRIVRFGFGGSARFVLAGAATAAPASINPDVSASNLANEITGCRFFSISLLPRYAPRIRPSRLYARIIRPSRGGRYCRAALQR